MLSTIISQRNTFAKEANLEEVEVGLDASDRAILNKVWRGSGPRSRSSTARTSAAA